MLIVAGALALAGCTEKADTTLGGSPPPVRSSVASPQTAPAREGFLLASSFEEPVCGVYWRPDPGCEFGVEGDVESGGYDCRTGAMCVRLQRMNPDSHVGVLAVAAIPGGRAFVGVALRIPEIPVGAIPDRLGYLELEQLTPTDGSLPAWPVEVRIYPDRRLGLGVARVVPSASDAVALTTWKVPVNAWFDVVVEISNGDPAMQRMWVYGPDDRLVDRVSVLLPTRVDWVHGNRIAQKIGGRTSTDVPMLTFADDWYMATTFMGPLHIGADGAPIAS